MCRVYCVGCACGVCVWSVRLYVHAACRCSRGVERPRRVAASRFPSVPACAGSPANTSHSHAPCRMQAGPEDSAGGRTHTAHATAAPHYTLHTTPPTTTHTGTRHTRPLTPLYTRSARRRFATCIFHISYIRFFSALTECLVYTVSSFTTHTLGLCLAMCTCTVHGGTVYVYSPRWHGPRHAGFARRAELPRTSASIGRSPTLTPKPGIPGSPQRSRSVCGTIWVWLAVAVFY